MDKTTKVLLAIIAAALWLNLLKPLLPIDVYAGRDNVQDVNIVSISGYRIHGGEIPVTAK